MDPRQDALDAWIVKQERSAAPWLLVNVCVVVMCFLGWAVAGTMGLWALAVALGTLGCLALVLWLPFTAAIAGATGRRRHVLSKAAIEGRQGVELESRLDARRSFQRWLGSLLLADTIPLILLGMALMTEPDAAYLGLAAFASACFAVAGGIWGQVAASRTTELVHASRATA